MGASTTQKVIGSVQHLEYSIADAINKITNENKKALLLSREWRIKRHIYSEIPASERKLSYWTLYTRFCCQKIPGSLDGKKYDLAIINLLKDSLKLKTGFRSIHHKWWKTIGWLLLQK
jgi:hypothetical protein